MVLGVVLIVFWNWVWSVCYKRGYCASCVIDLCVCVRACVCAMLFVVCILYGGFLKVRTYRIYEC